MCIIIDANVAHELAAPTPDAMPVVSLLTQQKLRMVSGGQLKAELARTRLRQLYRQLLLAGSIIEFDDNVLRLAVQGCDVTKVRSNDMHVLGLARASGARILFSRDENLHRDFKNKALVDGPKGKIYQKAAHLRVLREGVCKCNN